MKRKNRGRILETKYKPKGGEKMKIDVTKILKDLKGKALTNNDEVKEVKDDKGVVTTKAKPATVFLLRDALINALLMSPQNTNPAAPHSDGKAKMDRYKLSEKIYANDVVEINTQQRDMIKDLVAAIYPGAIVSGQVWEMLERTAMVEEKPAEEAKKAEKDIEKLP